MNKPILWLLCADISRPDLPLVLPSVAWMARESGAMFECYLEAERDGKLFGRTGSTVLGGAHHQAWNYLHAVFDVRHILWGETALWNSSIAAFQAPVLAQSDSLCELYQTLLAGCETKPQSVVVMPESAIEIEGSTVEFGPYCFPEVFYRQAVALPPSAFAREETQAFLGRIGSPARHALFLNDAEKASMGAHQEIDALREGDDIGSISLRIANRWKHKAKGVVFGDPPAVLSQMASHCRAARVAVFAPKTLLPSHQVETSQYTEATSRIADETARLALEIGNRIIVGRQTGDGDILRWSQSGCCIQIIDPNRPAFPIVEAVPHVWAAPDADIFENEVSDTKLREWAREGRILTTLMWHSGEIAHNEAMLNLFELASWRGLKMGIGVHAQRYETAPQTWELLSIARSKGGVRGLIEPVLHSGGLGVLGEMFCPPETLRAHCEEALNRIRALAGKGNTPRGYLAFLDTDLATLQTTKPEIYDAIADSGLEYAISSVSPGRNRIIAQQEGFIALNQTPRVVHSASPFVRITTSQDLNTAQRLAPGWLIGTLDAPVVSFSPYIWREGSQFMGLVDALLKRRDCINVLPHTVARYAHILRDEGYLPA